MCWCWSRKRASKNALPPRLHANSINPGAGHCFSGSGLFLDTNESTLRTLRASVVALDAITWASYRQVIPFTLGTQRARAIWNHCQVFFDSEFVNEMIEGRPAKQRLAAVE